MVFDFLLNDEHCVFRKLYYSFFKNFTIFKKELEEGFSGNHAFNIKHLKSFLDQLGFKFILKIASIRIFKTP